MGISRVHRLIRLITLLQSDPPRSAATLTHELGVSRRTLFRDLKLLEAAGVPYYHDRKAGGYRIRSGYHLPPINLTVPETMGLMLLARTAEADRDRPMTPAALSAIYKLVATVPEDIRRACGDLVAHVSIEPERPVDGREESQFFTDLQQAIDRETACDIVYQPPIDREPIACRLRPYAMHLANNAWYVLGVTDHPDHAGEVRVFKLVRLQEVTPTEVRFTRPPGFRVSDKLGLAWRLNPEGKEHDVAVEFAPMVATNVAEVRWHETQRVEWLKTGGGSGSGSGGCRLHFRVDGLKEIAWWVCGYADQARVVKPAALRRMVAAMHRDAAERNAD